MTARLSKRLRGLVDLITHFSDDKKRMADVVETRAAAFLSAVATVEDHLRQVCCVNPLDCHLYDRVHETLMVWRVLQMLQV